jgi:hypothetical protein
MNQVTLSKLIARAIAGRNLLRVVYHDGTRTVAPYLIYATKDETLVLHGWQVSGAYRTTPPPDWCNLRLSDISSATILPKTFSRPHRDYNPASPQFHRVIIQLSPPRVAARNSA